MKSMDVKKGLVHIFDSLSKSISTYDSTSLLSQINQNKTDQIDPIILDLLNYSFQIYKSSEGMFDPTVQPLAKEWGFLTQNGEWMDTTKLPVLLKKVGMVKWKWDSSKILERPEGARIDFNAIAPGYAADVIASFLKNGGCNDFFINNGGEIVLSGERPDGTDWKIGIVSPAKRNNNNKGDTLYSLSNIALATSGNYNNKFEFNGEVYSHTISPKTGMPIQSNLSSATVLCDKAVRADAYATVCLTMNKKEALNFLKKNNLSGYLIYTDEEGFVQRVMVN